MFQENDECKLIDSGLLTPKTTSPAVSSGARLLSLKEYPPFRDIMRVAEGGRNRDLVRAPRGRQELEACLLRHPVGLLGVDVLGGPHQVFPGVLAAP